MQPFKMALSANLKLAQVLLILSLTKKNWRKIMKKILALFLMVIFMGSSVVLFAQVDASARIEQRQNRDKQQKKAPDVNSILARMEERKAEILKKLTTRFAKLNEKLSTLSERIDKASERLAKMATSDSVDPKKRAKVDARKKDRKAQATERYNKFKENITKRKTSMLENIASQKEKLLNRIAKLDELDRISVMEAFDKMSNEVKAEADKLADLALEKITATYQKIMSL